MLKLKRKPALFAAFCVQPYPAADPDLGVSGIGDPSAGKSLTDRWTMGQCEDFVANSAANFPRQGKASVCKLQAPLTKDCKRDIHIFFRNRCAGELSKDMLSRFLFLTGRLRSCGHEQQCLTLLGAGEVI